MAVTLVVFAGLGFGAATCGGDGSDASSTDQPESTTTTSAPPSTTLDTEPVDDAADGSASGADSPTWWPTPLDELDIDAPATWTVEVLATAPHDPEAFTQGLERLSDDRFLESTGLRGQSEIRVVAATTGEVVRAASLDPEQFGEGLTAVDDTVIQLTWQEEVARRWSLPDLEPLPSFEYRGEGWGLCLLDDRLAMTDGTSTLQWRDPETFELIETVEVTRTGEPVPQLNELECVDGHVVANIWRSPEIVVIDPAGSVVATIDAGNLVATIDSDDPLREVLNGIAAHPDGTFSLTGKLWPTRFVVDVIER